MRLEYEKRYANLGPGHSNGPSAIDKCVTTQVSDTTNPGYIR